jgi:hypothetical protein
MFLNSIPTHSRPIDTVCLFSIFPKWVISSSAPSTFYKLSKLQPAVEVHDKNNVSIETAVKHVLLISAVLWISLLPLPTTHTIFFLMISA